MNERHLNPVEAKLGALLRESRPSPPLPPRFQANVWRRIESADAQAVTARTGNWLDAVAAWVFRPRLAVAVATVVVLAGMSLGWREGEQFARHDAQARYLAAVAPNSLR